MFLVGDGETVEELRGEAEVVGGGPEVAIFEPVGEDEPGKVVGRLVADVGDEGGVVGVDHV